MIGCVKDGQCHSAPHMTIGTYNCLRAAGRIA